MTKDIKLKAETRDKKNGLAKEIREKGWIPGVVYGSGSENINLKINKAEVEKAYQAAGESILLDLTIDSQAPIKVLIKDIQQDPIKDDLIHIDFYRVDMNKKISTEIPLKFIGESKAVKELGGVLMKNITNVTVTCLPGDLISHIDVDISSLEALRDDIKVGDLKVPETIKIDTDSTEVVASVVEPQEEIIEEPEAEAEGAEGEGEAEAEGAEGEVKTGGGETKSAKEAQASPEKTDQKKN